LAPTCLLSTIPCAAFPHLRAPHVIPVQLPLCPLHGHSAHPCACDYAHAPPLSPSRHPVHPRSAPPLASVMSCVHTAAAPPPMRCHVRAVPRCCVLSIRPFHHLHTAFVPFSRVLPRPSHPTTTSPPPPLPPSRHTCPSLIHPSRIPLSRPYSHPLSRLLPGPLHDCAAHPCPVPTSSPHRLPALAPVWRCLVSRPHPHPLRITSAVSFPPRVSPHPHPLTLRNPTPAASPHRRFHTTVAPPSPHHYTLTRTCLCPDAPAAFR
jgi:hypothetical protein